MDVASAGSLLLMVLSAVGRCPLMALFTYVPEVVKSPSVPDILKATAKMSQGEWCEWDSTLATVQGTVRQTLTRVGTQCPGLWWKKYQLRRSKSESSITLENNYHDSLMIIVETNICLVVALAGIKICHIWYTLSNKTLFTSRCYAGSILCTYLPIPKLW